MTTASEPAEIGAAPGAWRNPLWNKRDERIPRIASAVIIFGVTGDLARKKPMPAVS